MLRERHFDICRTHCSLNGDFAADHSLTTGHTYGMPSGRCAETTVVLVLVQLCDEWDPPTKSLHGTTVLIPGLRSRAQLEASSF